MAKFCHKGRLNWKPARLPASNRLSGSSIHRGSFWSPKSSQSIEIVWTTGFSGLVIFLKTAGTDLRGEALPSSLALTWEALGEG